MCIGMVNIHEFKTRMTQRALEVASIYIYELNIAMNIDRICRYSYRMYLSSFIELHINTKPTIVGIIYL